jgi:hypothetical protein
MDFLKSLEEPSCYILKIHLEVSAVLLNGTCVVQVLVTFKMLGISTQTQN